MFGCLLSSCVSSPASLIILPIPREPAAPTPISDSQDAGTTSFRGRGDHDIAPMDESTMPMPRWVVWIAIVGIRKAYENIVKSLQLGNGPTGGESLPVNKISNKCPQVGGGAVSSEVGSHASHRRNNLQVLVQVIRFGQPSSKAGRKHLALRVQKAGPLDI